MTKLQKTNQDKLTIMTKKQIIEKYSPLIKNGVLKGNVDISYSYLTQIPEIFKNITVTGYFYCSYNQLTTLDGSPKEVGGGFNCTNNQLTTLEGSPSKVGGSFYCSDNQLTTLDGSPKEVGGSFYCYYNQLTTLDGSPKEVGGWLFSKLF